MFAEIYAWNEPELAFSVTTATLTSMTVATGSIDLLFGLNDGATAGTCVEFSRTAGTSPILEFTLP